MAERTFQSTIEQAEKLFRMLLDDGCDILRDLPQKEDRPSMITRENIRESLDAGRQFFIKHPSFSECTFELHKIFNIHQGEVYVPFDIDGDGHLRVNYNPFQQHLDIGYGSFFEYRGEFINPSPELKAYYKRVLAMARKVATPVPLRAKGTLQ